MKLLILVEPWKVAPE